jgi:hypothetical protein
MLDTKHSRNTDGELTISNSNGTAKVFRTPGEALVHARPWTLEMNDHVHETYDSEEEAISSAPEILALNP